MEKEYGIEFWEKGKHVITLSQKANDPYSAWNYAEGRLADLNLLEDDEGRPAYTYDEVRILSPERYAQINQQIKETV